MSRLERIVAVLGGIVYDNGARALIPGPGHGAKDRSVSLRLTEDARILIHCFSAKDDWRAVRAALAEKGLLEAERRAGEAGARIAHPRIAAQPAADERTARAQRLWEESLPIALTPASVYLRIRAIPETLSTTPALRFHPRMTSLDDRLRRPALIAAVVDAAGALQGVQATLLSRYGRAKAPVPTPRRIVGRLAGGVVRLAQAQAELLIGEGVETMLSASAALGLPAWAALTAGNLAGFEPPASVRRLVVAADNDAAGRAAFAALAERLGPRLHIACAPPPSPAKDWNAWAQET